MAFSPFPQDADDVARELGLPLPSQNGNIPPLGYRPPADSRTDLPPPASLPDNLQPPPPPATPHSEPYAERFPLLTAMRALTTACEGFARVGREFEDHPCIVQEHWENLQRRLKEFELATLVPGDEHADDRNQRLHNVVTGLTPAVTIDRVRAYLDRSTEPNHYGVTTRPRWSRHFVYEHGDELWLFVAAAPTERFSSTSVLMPPRRDAVVPDVTVTALVNHIARVEGRHRFLVITDMTGPGCAP